jgi:hypothetical protein
VLLDAGMKMPHWSGVLPFAIVLVYFLVGLLGHYLNMTFIHGE